MQLRQPEPLGVLDQHDRRIGDVDPHLDHRRGDQQVDLPVAKRAHRGVLLLGGLAPMQQCHPAMGEVAGAQLLEGLRGRAKFDLFAFVDQRQHDVGLTPERDLGLDEAEDLRPRLLAAARGGHRLAPRRPLVEDAHIEVTVQRERERARDRRRRHQQGVGT